MDAEELRAVLESRLRLPGKVAEVVDEILALENDPETAALNALVANLGRTSGAGVTLLEERRLAAGEILSHIRMKNKPAPMTFNQTFLPGQVAPQVPPAKDPDITADENYDEDTLLKVARALTDEGMPPDGADNIIRILLNAGILFRERRPT